MKTFLSLTADILIGSIYRGVFRMWDSYVRPSRSHHPSCNSSKGTSIHQHSSLILIGLWCHWCHEWCNCIDSSDPGQHSTNWHGRKPSVKIYSLAKQLGITHHKAKKTVQAITQRRNSTILYPSSSRQIRTMIIIFVIIIYILCFQTWCLPIQCPEGTRDMHKYMSHTFDGLELSQWHQETKHAWPCHCYYMRWCPSSLC